MQGEDLAVELSLWALIVFLLPEELLKQTNKQTNFLTPSANTISSRKLSRIGFGFGPLSTSAVFVPV